MRLKRLPDPDDPRPRELVTFDPSKWGPGDKRERLNNWRHARRAEYDAGAWPHIDPLVYLREERVAREQHLPKPKLAAVKDPFAGEHFSYFKE